MRVIPDAALPLPKIPSHTMLVEIQFVPKDHAWIKVKPKPECIFIVSVIESFGVFLRKSHGKTPELFTNGVG
jgi:hypothetical protein